MHVRLAHQRKAQLVTHFRRGGKESDAFRVRGTMTMTATSCRSRRTITPRHNGPQAAVNYRIRSALVSAAFGESLVAAHNFRCNKETHIWRFHYRAQLFQGRGALNKFIRHLTVIKDTRHAEARVIAIVLSPPAQLADRLHNLALSIAGKRWKINGGRRWRGGDRPRERATWWSARRPHPRRRGVTAGTRESAGGSRGGQEAAGTRGWRINIMI